MEKREPSMLLVGMWIGAATVRSSMEVSQKSKSRTTMLPDNSSPGLPNLGNLPNPTFLMFYAWVGAFFITKTTSEAQYYAQKILKMLPENYL